MTERRRTVSGEGEGAHNGRSSGRLKCARNDGERGTGERLALKLKLRAKKRAGVADPADCDSRLLPSNLKASDGFQSVLRTH